jgi:antitoxin component YwqK of YwqJK toxin-antitoxin module
MVVCVSILCLVGLSSIAFSENRCKEGREISTPKAHYCLAEKDGREVKHGSYSEFHPDGKRKVVGEFVYGHKSGLWTHWSQGGQKVLEENYRDGEKQGAARKWYVNGQLAFEGRYEGGKPVGERLEWNMKGKPMAKNVYRREGDSVRAARTTWYDNGQEQSSATYIDGRLDGLETRWHKNGQKRSEFEYKDGQRNGLSREWYANGKEKSVNHFDMGKKEGPSSEWYDNGQKKSEGVWKNGRDGQWTYWEKDGRVREQIAFKAGKRAK